MLLSLFSIGYWRTYLCSILLAGNCFSHGKHPSSSFPDRIIHTVVVGHQQLPSIIMLIFNPIINKEGLFTLQN
jgi:hypothetical protein